VEGMAPDDAYSFVETLAEKHLILLDWGEHILEFLVKIDEPKAWPQIKSSLERKELRYGFAIRRFIKDLSREHQIEFLGIWTEPKIIDAYELETMVNLVLELDLENGARLEFLRKLDPRVRGYRGSYRDIDLLRNRVEEAIARLGPSKIQFFENE
jgi:hypothetical protein